MVMNRISMRWTDAGGLALTTLYGYKYDSLHTFLSGAE